MANKIERIVDNIMARKMRYDLGIWGEPCRHRVKRRFLPKPPPPKLHSRRHEKMAQDLIDDQEQDHEEIQNEETQEEWDNEQQPEDPEQQEAIQDQPLEEEWNEEDEWYGQETETAYKSPKNGEEDGGDEWTPEEEAQWETQQEWGENNPDDQEAWPNPEEENIPEADTPIPAPQIVPITPVKGVRQENRPQFLPLQIGKKGKGGAMMGYATPLTHPAPPGKAKGGHVHPINDPRLANFFAGKMVGSTIKGGWNPPQPPIMPKMKKRPIQVAQLIGIPVQSKAGPKKRRTEAPFAGHHRPYHYVTEEDGYEPSEDEDSSIDYVITEPGRGNRWGRRAIRRERREREPKRRHVMVELKGGKKVVAEYWDIQSQ